MIFRNLFRDYKHLLSEELYIIKLEIRLIVLLLRIDRESISMEEISTELSHIDKVNREKIITYFESEIPTLAETLKFANSLMEDKRRNEFIESFKNNTYKEYLLNLTLMELSDLKEDISRNAQMVMLSDSETYYEYMEYLELLSELETILLGIKIVDFDALEKLFESLTIEEIAGYLLAYPDTFIDMNPKSDKVREKIEEATNLIKNNKKVINTKGKELIYRNRKYF